MELRWQTSVDVSAMHAAWVLSQGRPLLDRHLQADLESPALALHKFADSFQLPAAVFWRQVLSMSVDLPGNVELSERLHRRLQGGSPSPASVSRLANAIAECESIFRQRFPNLSEQLALRIGPLQTLWEARGPGLLSMIGRSTEADFLVESATVVLVQPVFGGDGLAHLLTNRVHVEAVLTDVEPRLPETLRLAWLLGQLNLDRPVYSDRVHGHELGQVAELALMPVVLAAAEEVELARLNGDVLQHALQHWVRATPDQAPSLSEILLTWWETSRDGEWDWNTRLAGLALMLQQRS